VVVLHSLGLDRRVVNGIAPLLSGSCRLIAYDLRSHGASAAPPRTFDLERCAADLVELLDALQLERVHVAGFSLGGAIAQLAALAEPQRIGSLVLACTMARAKPDLYLERARAAEKHGSTEVQVLPTLRRWFSEPATAANPWYVDYARDCVRRASLAQWSGWWRSFATLDIADRIDAITCPTTLVAGEHDLSTLPSEMAAMAERIPDATFQVVAGGPHMTVLEQPDAIAGLLQKHLARVAA
jgi:3-oxoadipate enol-lactonase